MHHHSILESKGCIIFKDYYIGKASKYIELPSAANLEVPTSKVAECSLTGRVHFSRKKQKN